MIDLHLYLTKSSDSWLRESLTFISWTLTQPKWIFIKNARRFCWCLLLISQTEDSTHTHIFSKQAPYFLSHNWCLVLHIVQYLKKTFCKLLCHNLVLSNKDFGFALFNVKLATVWFGNEKVVILARKKFRFRLSL